MKMKKLLKRIYFDANNETHLDLMYRVRYFRPIFTKTGGPQEFF